MARAAAGKLGSVTVLVNNAGIGGPYGPVGVLDPEAWWAAQEVHILAPFLFMSAVLPGMIERRAGRIVNISSPRCHMLTANLSAYSLGKTAQNRLAELVANEVKEYGVKTFALISRLDHDGDGRRNDGFAGRTALGAANGRTPA